MRSFSSGQGIGNSRSDRLRQVLCALAGLLARVLRAHVASVEDATAELARVDGDIVAIGKFASDPSRVFDHLLVCACVRAVSGQVPANSRSSTEQARCELWAGEKRRLTAFAGGLCDEAAHRKDDRRRRARVDPARERDEEATHAGAAEIVPKPTSRAVSVRDWQRSSSVI